jgi:hypothetical protein
MEITISCRAFFCGLCSKNTSFQIWMERSMIGIRTIVATVSVLLTLAVTLPAAAQSLKDQAVGAWTLTSILEEFGDVKKDTWGPGVKGALLLESQQPGVPRAAGIRRAVRSAG